MSTEDSAISDALAAVLRQRAGELTIALSGGIDSLTLMRVAAEVRSEPTVAIHAVSAAVPDEASDRCRQLASLYNWQLTEIDAGEFNDANYVSNPVNRCYYCKSRLFDSMLEHLGGDFSIATGTNTEDLGDYRPGLKAAEERQVWQPYVEAGISKKGIRQLALQFGLGELSQLPAQPCLSSRIETGITINVDDLSFVHRLEKLMSERIGAGDIRCRIVSDGVVVQLPADCIAFTDKEKYQTLESRAREFCLVGGRQLLRIEPYKMGSAFLHKTEEDKHV